MQSGLGIGGEAATHPGSVADESVVRVVVTAGREAVRGVIEPDGADTSARGIDAHAYRVVATALVTGATSPQLDRAFDRFAADPHGIDRFAAMVRRARQALVQTGAEHGGEVVSVDLLAGVAAVHASFLRAIGRRRDATEGAYERFASAVTTVVDSTGYDQVLRRIARGFRETSGMEQSALYVPGSEHARLVRVAADGPAGGTAPGALRVDRGLFADVIAGERPVYVTSREPLDSLGVADSTVRTLVAVPLRDLVGRPVGLALAFDSAHLEMDADVVEGMRRLGAVAEGSISAADFFRRNQSALATMPDLAAVAHREDIDVHDQLDLLARIVAEATSSDGAIVRIADPAGRYLETVAARSLRGDAVSDVIGLKTLLRDEVPDTEAGRGEHELVGFDADDALAGWSEPGRRMIDVLGARTLAVFPVGSLYRRTGVVYLVRSTARGLDEVDRSCARIVCSHMQHVIDRHVAELQTDRAIGAARNAIRLLGEALVAGVRAERTVRFVPRLFQEMFGTHGCRVWRRGRRGAMSLLAGAGEFDSAEPTGAVTLALDAPALELQLATERRPYIGAIAIDEYHGSRLAVEFELHAERSLGLEEQRLVTDVATRVSEALWSADQAIAHQHQIERVRALQNVIAAAHEQLSEAHVVTTVVDEVPAQYGADAAAVLVIGPDGRLEARANRDVPEPLVQAIETARHWVPDATGDERAAILVIDELGSDPRVASMRRCIDASGLAAHAVLVVPLTGREQTVGALLMLFAHGLPDGIDGESDMLPTFGAHVGSALLNAREFERERNSRLRIQRVLDVERENSRQIRALHEVSRTFAASLSLDETMRAVVEAMADRLDVDAVWIRTPGGRGDQMMLRAFYASHPELSDALERMVAPPDPRDDVITQQVMVTRQPVLVTPGEDEDPARWQGSEVLSRLDPFLQRGSTIAVLPIAIPNEVLGTVTMLSIDPSNRLTYDKVDIAAGVAGQAALALDNARLYQQQKNFAEVIQESLLPGRLPDLPGIDLGVLYRSATAGGADAPLIGGDFYDFLELDDGRLALAVGDVTGKGVGAAADTAMTKYIFRALAREHPSPSSFLRYANEVVCEEITPGKFVTLFYAVIDPRRNTVTCGNAGHPEPKIIYPRADGADPDIASIGMEGIALGIIPDQDYEQREYEFGPGASIVVYTDGVVEARRDSKLYGQFRLERRLIDEAGASAPQIAFAVYQDCAAYAADGLSDDVAIVVAQRLDEDPSGAEASGYVAD